MNAPLRHIDTTTSLFTQAVAAVRQVLVERRVGIVHYSGGKDSSVTLDVALTAAAELAASGTPNTIYVFHGDTLIENPEVAACAAEGLAGAKAFADRHGFTLHTVIAAPSLANQWAVRTIGAGKLPTMVDVGVKGQCTDDWKVRPQEAKKRRLLKALAAEGVEPFAIYGTRYEESERRAASMLARAETAVEVWTDKNGTPSLSPIAGWTTRDVFGHLHGVNTAPGTRDTYSDFDRVLTVYEGASTGSCPIDGNMQLGEVAAQRGGCGSRTGCTICLTIGERDRSLEAMVENDAERYGYMAGLVALRRFLWNTRHDLDRRQWVGRELNDAGYVKIEPDTYNAPMVEELLKYALTIDAEEKADAAAQGRAPRFQLISDEALIAIDVEWARRGLHRPFHALWIAAQLGNGARYPVPSVAEAPKQVFSPRFVFAGEAWGQDDGFGLHDALADADTCHAVQMQETRYNGQSVTSHAYETTPSFHVDADATMEALSFELPYLMQEYHDNPIKSPTTAYQWYLTNGLVTVPRSAQGKAVDLVNRATWMRLHRVAYDNTGLATLVDRSVDGATMAAETGEGADLQFGLF